MESHRYENVVSLIGQLPLIFHVLMKLHQVSFLSETLNNELLLTDLCFLVGKLCRMQIVIILPLIMYVLLSFLSPNQSLIFNFTSSTNRSQRHHPIFSVLSPLSRRGPTDQTPGRGCISVCMFKTLLVPSQDQPFIGK